MPAVGNTVTYSTTISPPGATAPISYSWTLDGGGTFIGNTTSSSSQVQWNSVGNYTLTVTASNSCNTTVSHFQVTVTQDLFVYTHTATECGTFTRNNCPGGCTPTTASYCVDATETRDSTFSQQQAVTNAVAAAVISAQQLVNAGGQTYANTNASCNNCPCTEIWTDSGLTDCGQNIGGSYDVCKQYKQQTNQCNSNVQWIEIGTNTNCPGCVQPCNLTISISQTNNGTNYTVVTTPSGGIGTIELSQNGGVGYAALGNAVLNAGTYTFCVREQANTSCTACQTFTLNPICNPNNWSNAGGQYCSGVNLLQNQVNECGGTQTITVQVNSPACCTSNWVDDGVNFTCGQNIGQDPCIVYKQQIDGCGNTRWVFDRNESTCGGCCVLPTVALAGGVFASNVSLPISGGPNNGRRFIYLSNQHSTSVEIEINLNGNITQTTIIQNTVGQIQFLLPTPWLYNSGDTINYKIWFSAYLPSCNVTSSGTVL